MKISKTLLGGVALFGMTGLASAQTKIYVTGSTAFRATAINEITNLLNANGGGFTIATDAAGASAVTSANAITYTGGKIGGTAVTIKASFSGSGSGIQTVASTAGAFTVNFLPDGATGTSNPNPQTSGNAHESAVPNIAFSDVFQGTTQFNNTFNGAAYTQLTDNTVGVVAFTFAGSKGFPTGLSMTPQIAQSLFPLGVVPLSQFTGAAGDVNTAIVATGRNDDSGTRLTAMAETNVGVFTTLTQYQPTAISGGVISSIQPYPAATINGVSHPAGDGGESSGGALRAYLLDTLTASAAETATFGTAVNGGFLVTYLGVSDFNAVSGANGTAVALNYTGVAESQTAIEQGSYTFWGYEHLDYKPSLSGVALTFAQNLAGEIQNATSATLSPNVSLVDMQVSRPGDGGTISAAAY